MRMRSTLLLNEYRCSCGKLLLKGIFFDGTLEIKCKRCGEFTKIGNSKLTEDSIHYLFILNNKGTIINASSSACTALGYPHNELLGAPFSAINPSFSNELQERAFLVLTKNNYIQLDTIHKSKSKKDVQVLQLMKLYTPSPSEKCILLSAQVNKTPIDSSAQAQKESAFAGSACDFYFDIDAQGIIEYMSMSFESFFGFSPESSVGKYYFDFLPISELMERKKTFVHFSSLEQPFRALESIDLSQSGREMHCDLYFAPTHNEGGEFVGYRVLGWNK